MASVRFVGFLKPFGLWTLSGGVLYSFVVAAALPASQNYRLHFWILLSVAFVACVALVGLEFVRRKYTGNVVDKALWFFNDIG